MELKIKRLSPLAVLPQYQTSGAAGMDLYALPEKPLTLAPGASALIPTGLALEVPEGYGAFLFARSGLAVKHGITLSNGVGVVDADYRGEVKVGLVNLSSEPYEIKPGERIAQLVLLPAPQASVIEVESLGETERGAGGFGSTGKK